MVFIHKNLQLGTTSNGFAGRQYLMNEFLNPFACCLMSRLLTFSVQDIKSKVIFFKYAKNIDYDL